jgi:hypothetical protein
MKRKLITQYEVAIFPYPLEISDLCAFIFDFPDQQAMAKFANSLLDKPFILSHAKVVGKNSLVVHFYIPKVEFSNFIEILNQLSVKGLIEDFSYVSLDVASFKRQTVSYEFFRKNNWLYDAPEVIGKLTGMVPIRVKARVSTE